MSKHVLTRLVQLGASSDEIDDLYEHAERERLRRARDREQQKPEKKPVKHHVEKRHE